MLRFCVSFIALAGLLAGLTAWGEEAAAKAATPPAGAAGVKPEPVENKDRPAPASAENKEAAAPAAEEKKESASGLPVFPLKSEYFELVADKSDEDEEAMRLEFHALEDILVALQACNDEYLKKNVSPTITTETAYRTLMLHAEDYRGHVVQLRGALEYYDRFPIQDNKCGLEVLYRGQLSTITGKLYTFFSIQRPPEELMHKPVRVTGVFLKRYAYMNRLAGTKLTWTPAVIARGLEAYSEADVAPTHDPISGTTALLICIFLAFIVVRVFFEIRRQRLKSARENPFLQQRRKQGGAAPAPKPPQKKQ